MIDIPPLQMEVVEHQVETLVCDCCGHLTTAVFPSEVTNPVQYGPTIKALVVPKKTKARNLAERLDHYRHEILAFVYDFNVSFDNNLAERDIRMLKVQQKVSGCFRSSIGADAFYTNRTYTSSLRKQGIDVWSALNSIFVGPLIEPAYALV